MGGHRKIMKCANTLLSGSRQRRSSNHLCLLSFIQDSLTVSRCYTLIETEEEKVLASSTYDEILEIACFKIFQEMFFLNRSGWHGKIRGGATCTASEWRRRELIDYIQRVIKGCFGTEVLSFGSVPLKTYLPDGDIDLTVLCHRNKEEELARAVCSLLEGEPNYQRNLGSWLKMLDMFMPRFRFYG